MSNIQRSTSNIQRPTQKENLCKSAQSADSNDPSRLTWQGGYSAAYEPAPVRTERAKRNVLPSLSSDSTQIRYQLASAARFQVFVAVQT